MTAALDLRTVPTSTPAPRRAATLDVLLALLLLALQAPLLLAVALAVKADGGPVLVRQTRVGRDGREFPLLKFRSMVVDAERRLDGLVSEGDGVRRDPRVTRVGATLHRHSLDELPQLLNVLTGTMSLVGPRPALPHEAAADDGRTRGRLTGQW